jgi:hypothetical protein
MIAVDELGAGAVSMGFIVGKGRTSLISAEQGICEMSIQGIKIKTH